MSKTLEFKWTVSRGRDTYGYNICSLYVNGRNAAACNGGGYDMKGTALGNYIAAAYADRLRALRPEDMEEQSHWERADPLPRRCTNASCFLAPVIEHGNAGEVEFTQEEKCPKCGSDTRPDYHAGKRVDDGRYFYGLTFHDPKFDPGKAVIGKDATDRTLGKGADGKTVEQAEADGESLGLERYQAFYSASSKVPTARHTVPLINGACGQSSVEKIMRAIGLTLEYVPTKKRSDSIYILHDAKEGRE
jgi:hypothetical protein